MATLQHTASLAGKCVPASVPTVKTERHSHMRSGVMPQRDTSVDEPPHKLLKIMPNPLQSVCLQGSTAYGSAVRSVQQQQQHQQRRLVPIQPKNSDATSPTLSPPCVVTMRRDMSDGSTSYRVLTAGAGAGVGASATTNASTTTTQSGEQKRNASQSRPFWRWPQSDAGAKHDSSPSARLATAFDRLVRSEAEDTRRATPDRRDAPRPPTADERHRIRTDCAGVAQPPRVAVVRPNARPGDQSQLLPPKAPDCRLTAAPTFARPLPYAASERKSSAAAPVRTVRRYDKSRMRPVANFLFNLGLELVGQYVAKSEALTSQAESRPTTLEQPGLAADTVLLASEPANVPASTELDAHMKVEIADQNGDTIGTLDVGSDDNPDAPTPITTTDCLSTNFHAHNQLAARLALLECEAVCKCEFCGFVTESQLVFARHKLTGWIRWVSEADASEIERHMRAKASRRAARKRIRRRRAKPGLPVRGVNGQASEGSYSPASHPSESGSDSDSASNHSKDDLMVASRKVRRQPTVQALQLAPEGDKDSLPRFASEWSIGEEPPDVFVGQCCACGFIATRYPFAYTAHLLTKHNISLTVDEATLSVARCPFCPYTLRTRNAVFKQHVCRCAARFDASTNQAPVSYIDELPVLLRGRQGPLVYELMEPEIEPDPESVYTSFNPLAPFRRPLSTHRSVRPPAETSLPFTSLSSLSNFPPSDTVRIDVSKALESARQHARENDHQSPMRTVRMPGSSDDVLRLKITSAGADADADVFTHISNCHGGDVADATADELQLGTDGPLDASWIERNLNMVATSKLAEYVTSVKRAVQASQPCAPAPAPASTPTATATSLEGDYCTFCDKRIRVGTDPRYHFTGGHLVAIRVQIRNCKCPFCNVPYSVTAPSVRFADVNQLHEHILAEHAQRQHRKAFWWVHVNNALRASGSTVNDPEADVHEDASAYIEMLKLATKPKLPAAPALEHKHFPASAADRPFDLTTARVHPSEPGRASVSPVKRPSASASASASSSVNDGLFCIFCAQSIRSKSNAYQHFVSNHLIAVRNKIHKRVCPLCELPGQPPVAKHAARFATVIKLNEHVEKMHRMLYRSPSAYWWPYVHSELRRAVRSSTDACTSAPASNVNAAMQPHAAAAHAHPSSATLPAAIARDRKGRAERERTADAAVNYDARSASDRPASSAAPNAKQSGGTYCAFCAQNIPTNTYLHFSGEHLVLLGIQIGKLECPLCCLSGAAAPSRFTDVADLTAHVTAEHAPTYRSAYWWPYMSAALSTAARTSVRARGLTNAPRPPGRPPKLAPATAPGPSRKRPAEPDLANERVEPTRVKAPPTAASHCLFCAKTITVNALYHFSGAHLSTMRSQVRNCECPLCGPTASASGSSPTGPFCFTDIRTLQDHCESAHGQYRDMCWWPYLIAALRAALAVGRSGSGPGAESKPAPTAANSAADFNYASNGLAQDDNLHAMIKID